MQGFPEEWELIRLSQAHKIKPFDCGDEDLNDFLLSDAKKYLKELYAVTYILESQDRTVAYYSLFNDRIRVLDSHSKNYWRRTVARNIGHDKKRKDYPSVKVGRLGVDKSIQGKGVGKQIVDYLKYEFALENKTGCRFITVDAYKAALKFYEQNDFNYLTTSDENDETRLMYYDLVEISNASDEN